MLAFFNREGYKICFRKSTFDEDILSDVLINDCYQGYKQYITPKTIIDLGAHIGAFVLRIRKDYPESRIWAWEIYQENFNLLQLNISFNNLKNIKIFEFGVGKVGYLRWINVSYFNTGANMLKDVCVEKELESPRLVLGATLDLESIFNITGEKEIDLVKMDIERGELEVFDNIDPTLIRRVKVYVMEVHSEKTNADIEKKYIDLENIFIKSGFTVHKDNVHKTLWIVVRNEEIKQQ